MGLFARAGAGLFAMIGGWPTVILAAGAAIYYLATRQNDAEKAADSLNKASDQLAGSLDHVTDSSLRLAQTKADEGIKALEQAQTRAADASKQLADALKYNVAHSDALAFAAVRAADDVDKLTAASERLNKTLAAASIAKQLDEQFALFHSMTQTGLADITAYSDKMAAHTAKLREQVETYGKGKKAVEEYELAQAIAARTQGMNEKAAASTAEAMRQQAAEAVSLQGRLDALSAAHKGASGAAREHSQDEATLTSILQKAAAAI
ncbi:hypothetical protein [Dokdonella soli]|uniref:Phage tail tape measure protein n=1 Tax=Dokdonella soli TaxID=529810 RepID=A0ABP3TSF0_9GAMM